MQISQQWQFKFWLQGLTPELEVVAGNLLVILADLQM